MIVVFFKWAEAANSITSLFGAVTFQMFRNDELLIYKERLLLLILYLNSSRPLRLKKSSCTEKQNGKIKLLTKNDANLNGNNGSERVKIRSYQQSISTIMVCFLDHLAWFFYKCPQNIFIFCLNNLTSLVKYKNILLLLQNNGYGL